MEKIDKNDARKVDSKTLQYLRDRTIKLRESGISNIETATILGLSIITTSRWYSKYKKDGEKALKVQKTGSAVEKAKVEAVVVLDGTGVNRDKKVVIYKKRRRKSNL